MIVLDLFRTAAHRPPCARIAKENAGQAVCDFLAHLEEVHYATRSNRAFDLVILPDSHGHCMLWRLRESSVMLRYRTG